MKYKGKKPLVPGESIPMITEDVIKYNVYDKDGALICDCGSMKFFVHVGTGRRSTIHAAKCECGQIFMLTMNKI